MKYFKQTIAILYFLVGGIGVSVAQNGDINKKFIVSTADEFVKAIASNRIIEISSDTLFLRNIEKLKSIPLGSEARIQLTENVYYLAGNGITIFGVSNLKIIGSKNNTTTSIISTKDKGDIVLTFRECKNIVLENFEANHLPKTDDWCQGGVLFFDKCKNIQIDSCIIIGSGAFGIQCNDVDSLSCRNTIINKCSSLLFELNHSSFLKFNNCQFTNIRSLGYLTIATDCQFIEFEKCCFRNNYSDTTSLFYKTDCDFMFYFYEDFKSQKFFFDKCTFSNIKVKWFTNKNDIIIRHNCKYINNDNLR